MTAPALAPAEWRGYDDAEGLPDLPAALLPAAERGLRDAGTICGTLHQAARTPVYMVEGQPHALALSYRGWGSLQARIWNAVAREHGLPAVWLYTDFAWGDGPADGLTAAQMAEEARKLAESGWHWRAIAWLREALYIDAKAPRDPRTEGVRLEPDGPTFAESRAAYFAETLLDIARRTVWAVRYDTTRSAALRPEVEA